MTDKFVTEDQCGRCKAEKDKTNDILFNKLDVMDDRLYKDNGKKSIQSGKKEMKLGHMFLVFVLFAMFPLFVLFAVVVGMIERVSRL